MPTCEEYYIELNSKCNQIIKETFCEVSNGAQSQSHNFLHDLNKWIELLNSRLELPLIISAQKEYQYGLLALVQGQYRQAYMALRLFLEQSLAGVQFSANELELRRWLSGHQDIIWENIIDEENGIYSKKFVDAFCPPLVEEAIIYRKMAKNVYRECSEYIHANFRTHKYLPESLEYNREVFMDWHEKAETIRMVILFAFCIRYFDIFKNHPLIVNLEACITEYLGHIYMIRKFFE